MRGTVNAGEHCVGIRDRRSRNTGELMSDRGTHGERERELGRIAEKRLGVSRGGNLIFKALLGRVVEFVHLRETYLGWLEAIEEQLQEVQDELRGEQDPRVAVIPDHVSSIQSLSAHLDNLRVTLEALVRDIPELERPSQRLKSLIKKINEVERRLDTYYLNYMAANEPPVVSKRPVERHIIRAADALEVVRQALDKEISRTESLIHKRRDSIIDVLRTHTLVPKKKR